MGETQNLETIVDQTYASTLSELSAYIKTKDELIGENGGPRESKTAEFFLCLFYSRIKTKLEKNRIPY